MTGQVDASEFEDAIKTGRIKPPDVEKAKAAHKTARELVTGGTTSQVSSSLTGGTSPTLLAPTVKTAGVDVVAVPGSLTIGDGVGGSGVNKVAIVRETGSNQIASTAAVTTGP